MTGAHNKRVSLAALICVKPGQRPRLIYRTHTSRRRGNQRKGFTETGYARLLDAAHQQLGGPIVLVWDNLNARHEAPPCLPGGDGRAPPLACRSRLVKLRAAESWRHRTRWEQP